MYNIFMVAFSYSAALVGAGFASGQEIISFFVRYGKMSFWGIALSALLFGVFAAVILCECVEKSTVCYSRYLDNIMSKHMKRITELLTLIYGLCVFCVMASCCGEMGYALFGISASKGVILICAVCAIVFALGTDNAMDLNAVLGFIIVTGVITCCFYILTYREHQTFLSGAKPFVSSLSYSGYNLLSAGAILSPLSRRLKTKSEAILAGFISSVSMFMMMFLMWWILCIYYGKINLGEIPMLTMAMRQNGVITVIYSILLFTAVLSTAISNGISCINILCTKMGRFTAGAIVIACGLCFGTASFSSLINTAYRLCGYAGIFIVGYIIVHFIKTHIPHLRNNLKK